MRIGSGMMICLLAASVSVSTAQEAKSVKATHRTRGHPASSPHHAKHAASTTVKKTEAYVNQGPLEAEAEAKTATVEPAVEAAPVVEPVVVTYEAGALGITTHDAPLREILHKVREATGAIVEAPDLEQRVSVTVVAEAPVQAIAALLDGMHLDYAMLGGTSVHDPVRTIIIAPRGNATRGGPTAAAVDTSEMQSRTPGVIPPDQGALENPPARSRPARDH